MRFVKFSRTSRRALPGLNALKTSLELLSKAGSAVPPLQAVAETALKIIEYAEVRHFAVVVLNANESLTLVTTGREEEQERIG